MAYVPVNTENLILCYNKTLKNKRKILQNGKNNIKMYLDNDRFDCKGE